jgi:predicted RNA-binding protein YlxR (DUF448 family)
VKRELVRLVCAGEGQVEVDPTGKKSGRGAYLCTNLDCWQRAVESGRLENALRTTLRPENKETLVKYAKEFDNSKSSSVRPTQSEHAPKS